jgi:tripartite-type tricarboxylate transporter receptor subunit TctC
MMMTRKEFLEEVMEKANLKDLKQADDASRAVIGLTKLIIGPKLSAQIAKISPPDLREGWESIRSAFPSRPIKIITGPGGEDADVRKIVPYVQKYLGAEIVVENIPGFWGKMAFENFQTAAPDGYTLISYTFPRSIMVEKMSQASFKTKDFTSVFAWSVGSQLLVVSPGTYDTFEDFLKAARARTLTGAIPVRGGTSHIAGLFLADDLGIKVNWIPCEGSASSFSALARKDVDFTICLASSVPSWIRSGKIKALAVLPNGCRSGASCLPDVPSLTALGYAMKHVTIRHVVQAPPNTPAQIVSIVEDAFSRAIKEPAYVEWARNQYVMIDPLDAQELSAEITASYPELETLTQRLGQ